MLLELAWLPQPPSDFGTRLKALRGKVAAGKLDAVPEGLRCLSEHALDLNQLDKLARTLGSVPADLPGLRKIKLGILGDGTQDLIVPAIAASGLRHGLAIEVVSGDYGGMVQQALDGRSPVRAAAPDFVLVAADYRMLGLAHAQLGEGAADRAVAAALATLQQIVAALRPSATGGVLVQTLVPPLEPLFGSLDAVQPGVSATMVAALNNALAAWAATRDIILVDIATVSRWIGLDHWTDPARWHAAKLPCSLAAVPLYADVVARTLAAATIGPRKCLVLDLDNTLWGGVVGDDGVDGITLGQGSGAGEAFQAIQRMALELRSRGVILAVCSKNEMAAAVAPFREHPEMLLKESDIAVFQANWVDKASNLRVIAAALNIGTDALVFLDDNPAERAQVRAELPMVAVPELPDDPALFPRALQCAGYFETLSFLDEDRLRANSYSVDAARRALSTGSGDSDMASYLASLDMVCDLRAFDAVGRARISQLVNKSNQFNLTTRRCTEAEVAAIESDPTRYTLQVRLADRFGDNGMISAIVFEQSGDGRDWVNDIWLMSCRVLGRRVEEAVLAVTAAAARRAGAKRLIGRYLPSPKNMMVADHYRRLGFALLDRADDGSSRWALDLDEFAPPELPMRLTGSAVESALL